MTLPSNTHFDVESHGRKVRVELTPINGACVGFKTITDAVEPGDWIEGSLRFDGCINFSGGATAIHMCQMSEARVLAEVIEAVYRESAQLFDDAPSYVDAEEWDEARARLAEEP